MSTTAAQFNQHLTNYAHGLSQDTGKSLANFAAPPVPVGTASGQYKSYDDKNAFQVYATRRAIGGKAKRIEFEGTDPFFNCAPNALEIGIDDHEREQAGTNQTQLQEAKTRTLVTSATLSHEDETFTKIFAALAAVIGAGVWSTPTVDPIAEIDAQIEAIATETGMLPNRIAIGLGAWRVLKNHPLVRARFSNKDTAISFEQISGLFLNPGIEVRIGIMSKDTKKFGVAKVAAQIIGAEVLVFSGSDSPNVYDPSFAKTFRTVEGGVDAVETYRDESSSSDIVRVKWSDDIKVTAAASGRRITVS